jgi:hypothetical protein
MKVGEPITYVDTVSVGGSATNFYRKGLIRSEVEEALSYVFLAAKSGSPFLGPEEEGVRWVRGHYNENSEVGQALLAAYALSRSLVA